MTADLTMPHPGPVRRPPPPDGRNLRADATVAAVLASTRELMQAGDFRPTFAEITVGSNRSTRSVFRVFQHFGSLEGVHLAALDDVGTRDAVLRLAGIPLDNLTPDAKKDIAGVIVLGGAPAAINDVTAIHESPRATDCSDRAGARRTTYAGPTIPGER